MDTIVIISIVLQCVTTIALCLTIFAITIILKAKDLPDAKQFFAKPKRKHQQDSDII